jgi:hypothetical protein
VARVLCRQLRLTLHCVGEITKKVEGETWVAHRRISPLRRYGRVTLCLFVSWILNVCLKSRAGLGGSGRRVWRAMKTSPVDMKMALTEDCVFHCRLS